MKLEEERQALAAFVKKFDQLGLGGLVAPPLPPTKFNPPMPTPGGAAAVFAQRQLSRISMLKSEPPLAPLAETESPIRLGGIAAEPSLMEEQWEDIIADVSIEMEKTGMSPTKSGFVSRKLSQSPVREVLSQKENVPV